MNDLENVKVGDYVVYNQYGEVSLKKVEEVYKSYFIDNHGTKWNKSNGRVKPYSKYYGHIQRIATKDDINKAKIINFLIQAKHKTIDSIIKAIQTNQLSVNDSINEINQFIESLGKLEAGIKQ